MAASTIIGCSERGGSDVGPGIKRMRISPQYQSRSAVFPLNVIRYDLLWPFFSQTLWLEQLCRIICCFSPPDLEKLPQAAMVSSRILNGAGCGLTELLPPAATAHPPPSPFFLLWPNGIKCVGCTAPTSSILFFLFHYCCHVLGGNDDKGVKERMMEKLGGGA